MGKQQTIEERVGILEQGKEDCQFQQTERYKEMMKRVERLENKLTGALGIGVILILTTLANIAIALLKR
jgi:hypothetical protein